MRFGLIGCGRIAASHVKSCAANSLELTALCDTDPSKIEAVLKERGCAGAETGRYTDYKQMIEENDLELIAVATDSGSHFEIARYCLTRGLHVIVEKPLALSVIEADILISEAERHHVKLAVCHQNRFNEASLKMHEARENGRFGKLSHASVHIRWNRNRDYYNQAQWRGKWDSDGGALMNQCIHGIDLLLWMIGSPLKTVYGVTRRQFHDYIECEDVGMAVFSFADGTVATVEGTVNVFPKKLEETLYLFGESGTAKIGGAAANEVNIWEFAHENKDDAAASAISEEILNDYGNGHARLYADMLAAIAEDREPLANAVAGRNALEAVLAIYKSQKEGRPVSLPLREFSSNDMAGTF